MLGMPADMLYLLLILLLLVQVLQHALMLVLMQVLGILLWGNAENRGIVARYLLVPWPIGRRWLMCALLGWLAG